MIIRGHCVLYDHQICKGGEKFTFLPADGIRIKQDIFTTRLRINIVNNFLNAKSNIFTIEYFDLY